MLGLGRGRVDEASPVGLVIPVDFSFMSYTILFVECDVRAILDRIFICASLLILSSVDVEINRIIFLDILLGNIIFPKGETEAFAGHLLLVRTENIFGVTGSGVVDMTAHRVGNRSILNLGSVSGLGRIVILHLDVESGGGRLNRYYRFFLCSNQQSGSPAGIVSQSHFCSGRNIFLEIGGVTACRKIEHSVVFDRSSCNFAKYLVTVIPSSFVDFPTGITISPRI